SNSTSVFVRSSPLVNRSPAGRTPTDAHSRPGPGTWHAVWSTPPTPRAGTTPRSTSRPRLHPLAEAEPCSTSGRDLPQVDRHTCRTGAHAGGRGPKLAVGAL